MPTPRKWPVSLVLLLSALSLGLGTGWVPPAHAQSLAVDQYFPETNHAVNNEFLRYWNGHGKLAQQGYPLSERFLEKSDLDGKIYPVQYFERAVFEYHSDNPDPAFEVQ